MESTSTRRIAQLVLAAMIVLPMLAMVSAGTAQAQIPQPPVRQRYFYTFDKDVAPWIGYAFGLKGWPNTVLDGKGQMPPYANPLALGSGADPYAALNTYGQQFVWMQTGYIATAPVFHMRFDVSDVYKASSMVPMVYVGPQTPRSMSEFIKVGEPLRVGPQTLQVTVNLGETKMLEQYFVVGIGLMNQDPPVEKQLARIDNVNIVIDGWE